MPNFFKQTENIFKILGVSALLLGISSVESFASVGSKWSSSSIAKDEGVSQSRSRDLGGDVSPFSPGSHNIAVDLGQVFLMGDLAKYTDSIGTQLHYTYGVSDLFGFDSSIGYSQHSDARLSMLSVLTGMRMNMSWYDKIIPYAKFGLGFYRPSYRDQTVPNLNPASSLSAVLFGIHLGPGIDLELSKNLFFGASITFHNMFGTTKTWADGSLADLGGTYTTFLLHAGATF
jgi:hypothetical protein